MEHAEHRIARTRLPTKSASLSYIFPCPEHIFDFESRALDKLRGDIQILDKRLMRRVIVWVQIVR